MSGVPEAGLPTLPCCIPPALPLMGVPWASSAGCARQWVGGVVFYAIHKKACQGSNSTKNTSAESQDSL